MKITEVRAHPLSVPYDQPRWTAHERMERDQVVLVEVRTDQGLVGYGEIAGGPQKLICDLVGTFGAVISGMDPLGHVEIWQLLFSLTSPRPGGIGGWDGMPAPLPRIQRPQAMAALGGIDIALWDIKGKAVGLPVFRLLGGTRTEVFTYATGGYYREGEALEACGEEFGRFVAAGYRAVKLKTGALSLADEVMRIRAVRAAIGPDVKLMLDMNAPYDVAGCIRFADAVAPFDIFWLEEPLHWYLQPVDYVRLAAASPIPLAHGEREWHRFTVRDFIDSGAIRFVQFDSTRAAGFTESLRIAHYAEQKGVVIAPHSALHVHAHLVSAFGDAAFGAEAIGDHGRHPIHHAIHLGGAVVEDGMARLSEAPGFGMEIDWTAVERLGPQYDRMLVLSFWLLLIAGVFGSVLAAMHLRTGVAPPRALFGVLHGVLGVIGLVGLLIALRGPPRGVAMGVGSFGRIAAVLLVLGALAGLAVPLLRLRRRRVPGSVIGIHATIAISGVVVLAAYALLG